MSVSRQTDKNSVPLLPEDMSGNQIIACQIEKILSNMHQNVIELCVVCEYAIWGCS